MANKYVFNGVIFLTEELPFLKISSHMRKGIVSQSHYLAQKLLVTLKQKTFSI